MGDSKNPTVESSPRSVAHVSPDSASRWIDLALQFFLFWFLATAVWHLLGPEPQSALAHRLRLVMIGMGLCLSCGFWMAGTPWRLPIKQAGIAASLLVMLTTGVVSDRNI